MTTETDDVAFPTTPVAPPKQVNGESFETAKPVPVIKEAREWPAPLPDRTTGAVGRTLPHSIEAEEHLLSCCLLDGNDVIARCLEAKIKPSSFYDPKHGVIFECLLDLFTRKEAIDVSVVAEELKTRRLLDQVGGYSFLVQVSSRIPTTAQASYFVDKVREQALLREIIRSATGTVEDCYSFSGGIDEFAQDVRRRLTAVLDSANPKLKSPYTVWQPAQFRDYTPPPNLDLLGSGYIRRRQLTTLIGPPGVGKSRLSLWLACCHIAGRNFMGLDTHGPAKWLFFGNENDPLRQKTDLAYFYKQLLPPEQTAIDQNLFLHVLDRPDDGIITLADPEAYAKLLTTLQSVSPDIVVFDPWGNMIEGNENDNEEVRRTLKLLLRAIALTCPNAAIIVIHHARTGKSTAIEAGNNFSGGSLGRGSKALVSSARCELALWPGHSEDSSRLVLTCEKVNNVKKFDPKGLLFENGIYREDLTFDLDAWKDDIAGVRSSGKTLTIDDLVQCVRQGIHKRKDIILHCEKNNGVGSATVARRLKEAIEKDWLQVTQPLGSYTLGSKVPVTSKPKPTPPEPFDRWPDEP